jgi:multidrug efflux pump subunit AcrA (membrane-fusion protein)
VVLGTVVFLPRATTVTAQLVSVGDEVGDGTPVLELSGSSQHVVITVPDELQSTLVPGLAVEAGGQAATVTRLEGGESDDALSVQATVTPSQTVEDWAAGDVVKVEVSEVQVQDALLVPSDALVSRLDGGYALQVSMTDGQHAYVAVEVLGVSNGKAAVRGSGVTEGLTIYRPA